MPSYTTLLDDQVPLITFDNNWQAGSSQDDDLASLYYAGTFTTCNVTGGRATLTFNGTGVWIYGAKRVNHGTYTVQVDDSTYSNLSGYSGTEVFQQLLFNQSGLMQGTHKLSITNTDTTGHYVDLDLIVVQSEVGDSDQQLVSSIIQDTEPAFSYQPSQAWSTDPPYVQLYNNGTGHSSATSSATATLKFTFISKGDVISLYGTIGSDTGQYSVQLDSQPAMNFSSNKAMRYTQMMLFHADNLGPGEHQLKLTNLPQSATQLLNIDYAEVMTLARYASFIFCRFWY
ncbi:hypothetical protein CONPUDRAFT_49001 [Coniophora puteana RWD-64-598 SS2]|uniref:Uncharacterized protein n=1 Tax=Coniophora puteana (strain RWD-64-598) TaxID=741705 RepID=A0A5M3N2Q4_CONPW|nr:uncharacterized protein CONPUDRAFT_49001 [Coniophora puteana RWD-64-598 SS2]EIW85596.1 hypothetical protein CONPUDRAFT_49001 [Coniophora puteana RWD-64-598 SS2]